MRKMKKSFHGLILFLALLFLQCSNSIFPSIDYYQIKIYQYESDVQEDLLNHYFENAYLPALHRYGISDVGVFSPREQKEDRKQIFVWIPFTALNQFESLETFLLNDAQYQQDGKDYIQAAYDQPPYTRIESILLRAFRAMPEYAKYEYETSHEQRIYELRSYEGPTELQYQLKVEMFNEGEAELFMDIGCNPLFFGEVISGSHMPNLMYMTTYANEAAHQKGWETFREHPDWQVMKNIGKYKNTVSHIDKFLLYPAPYSDI